MLLVATVVYGEPGAIYFNSRSPFVRCGRWRRCGRPPHLTTNDVNFVDDTVVAARASDGLPRHTQLVLAGEGRARWWRWRWVHCPPQRDSASVHHRDATDRGLNTAASLDITQPTAVSFHSACFYLSLIRDIRIAQFTAWNHAAKSQKENATRRLATAQTDRASAFVVDRIKIFLTSIVWSPRKIWLLFFILCARTSQKNGICRGPTPWDGASLTP